METSERKQSLRSDESVWRYLRILVGQLVSARTVVGELIKKQAMDEEAQDMFVSVVLHDEHLQAHPPSSKYLKTLLQLYAREIDSANEALSDSFAYELAQHNQTVLADEPNSNTCFFVADDCVVYCRAAIEHNDVGLRMWEAGLFLTELVYHYRHRMKEKRILELGAGLGLTSLCVAKAVPAHVVISDYSFSTLANIRYNIELNVFHEGSHVEEAQLDWCTVTSEHVQELNPDIILAADTVYDLSVIPAFCDTLKLFVANPDRHNVSTEEEEESIDWTATPIILVAVTRRNNSTYNAFMRGLEERNLRAVNISAAVQAQIPQQLHYSFRDLIQLLQVVAATP